MKLLLLCLGLTLVWAHKPGHHHVVTSNFDLSKLSGKWYTVLIGSDDMEEIEENGNFRFFMGDIKTLDSSSMLLEYYIKVNGQCNNLSTVANETAQDGVYSAFYHGYNRIHIIEAVYDEYVVLRSEIFNNERSFQVMPLYAREPDLSQKIKTRFEELCQKYRIPKENIIDMTKVDGCP